MDYLELIYQIFEVCIIPLLGLLTTFVIKYLNNKINQIKINNDNETLNKYLDMLYETIEKCVISTNQTYVESLKQQGKFDLEAQLNAFKLTYDSIIKILGEESIKYLNEAVGDLDEFINNAIEAEVNKQKMNKAVTHNAA